MLGPLLIYKQLNLCYYFLKYGHRRHLFGHSSFLAPNSWRAYTGTGFLIFTLLILLMMWAEGWELRSRFQASRSWECYQDFFEVPIACLLPWNCANQRNQHRRISYLPRRINSVFSSFSWCEVKDEDESSNLLRFPYPTFCLGTCLVNSIQSKQ